MQQALANPTNSSAFSSCVAVRIVRNLLYFAVNAREEHLQSSAQSNSAKKFRMEPCRGVVLPRIVDLLSNRPSHTLMATGGGHGSSPLQAAGHLLGAIQHIFYGTYVSHSYCCCCCCCPFCPVLRILVIDVGAETSDLTCRFGGADSSERPAGLYFVVDVAIENVPRTIDRCLTCRFSWGGLYFWFIVHTPTVQAVFPPRMLRTIAAIVVASSSFDGVQSISTIVFVFGGFRTRCGRCGWRRPGH